MTQEVIAADREAAAALYDRFGNPTLAEACRAKRLDDHFVVQAFAAHRRTGDEQKTPPRGSLAGIFAMEDQLMRDHPRSLPNTDLSEERALAVLENEWRKTEPSKADFGAHPWPIALRAMQQYAAGLQGEVEALSWFGRQHRLSLYHYSPIYGDDDDQSVEWRVDQESGSINDREWTTVGRGETPIAAILCARTALGDTQ